MTQNFDVNKELDKVLDMPLDKVAPNAVKRGMSMDEVNKILEQLAIIFCIQPAVATIAASLLLLKGAANSGAPKSMDVAVICPDTKKEITITKKKISSETSVDTKDAEVRIG